MGSSTLPGHDVNDGNQSMRAISKDAALAQYAICRLYTDQYTHE